jgi:hypothetical protein
VQEYIDRGEALRWPASTGVAVWLRRLPAAVVKKLHDAGDCLGCFFHYRRQDDLGRFGDADEIAALAEREPDAAELGLFTYSHLCENWISGPYGRDKRPRVPLHVDQLPPRAREALEAMRFRDLCFGEAPHVQPAGQVDCISWESNYLMLDGKTERPMPGQ